MGKYSGSCHCGKVAFSVHSDLLEFTTCDCSLCTKKNAVMVKVHESEFELHSAWGELGLYQWNTQVAKHYFCKTCGIYTFHRKRAAPDCYGINVFCIDNAEISQVIIRETEGANMTVECTSPRKQWPGPRR